MTVFLGNGKVRNERERRGVGLDLGMGTICEFGRERGVRRETGT